MSSQDATLEWFGGCALPLLYLQDSRLIQVGATTFRLKVKGITMFLDTWLERPPNIPSFLKVDDVEECDYIFISHAHFDQ